MGDRRLEELFVILMALPLVSMPFIFWYWSPHGAYELSLLQLTSAVVLLVAVVLAVFERFVPRLRKVCEFSLPRAVKVVALGILAMVVLWSLSKGG